MSGVISILLLFISNLSFAGGSGNYPTWDCPTHRWLVEVNMNNISSKEDILQAMHLVSDSTGPLRFKTYLLGKTYWSVTYDPALAPHLPNANAEKVRRLSLLHKIPGFFAYCDINR